TETSLDDWHRVLAVNLHSAFYLARAVVPAMKERRRGSIIAIGGQSSLTSRPNTAAVTAAKTGLLGLVRALAAELGPFGIRANMVMPGFMDTERRYAEWYPELSQSPPGSADELAKIPLRRLGRPEEIADAHSAQAERDDVHEHPDVLREARGHEVGEAPAPTDHDLRPPGGQQERGVGDEGRRHVDRRAHDRSHVAQAALPQDRHHAETR